MAEENPVYEFDWDEEKATENRRKHRVGFEEAATVFLDPRALSVYDTDHSAGEDRWVTLGLSSAGRLLVVCHTFREAGDAEALIRLISSRKATKKEDQQYGK